MNEYQSTIESAITGVARLRSILKKDNSAQIRSLDERTLIKATSLAWFNKQRITLLAVLEEPSLQKIDTLFNLLLGFSDKHASRNKVDILIKDIRNSLTTLRSEKIAQLSSTLRSSSDNYPNFLSLVSDKGMIAILERRWDECISCVKANAPLAATVMMGGLLESLLLSKFLQYPDKKEIFKAAVVPKDKTGTQLQFKDWTLRNYIDVAHELRWISQAAKDISEVLRDYRNYIHPSKEKSHGIRIEPKDAVLLWDITKSIARQLT